MDEKLFDGAFRMFYPRLKAYAGHFLSSEERAEDVVQDCFVRLWECGDRYEEASLGGLLYRMVHNACINERKRELARGGFRLDIPDGADSFERMYNLDFGEDADAVCIWTELRSEIDAAVDSLPGRCAEVFRLSRVEGLRNREIARRLGISDAAVHKHLRRAISELKAKILH